MNVQHNERSVPGEAQTGVRGNRTWFMAGLLLTLGVAVAGSLVVLKAQYGLATQAAGFVRPIGEVYSIVSQRFINEIDPDALQNAAIKGMIDALDDPYTFYVPPAELDEFEKNFMGSYVGIGAAVALRDGWLTIITPLDGSPAIKAGVRAGDRVVAIEGVSTEGKTPGECVQYLMGEAGTDVTITVERADSAGVGDRVDITITRAQITTQTVRGYHRDDDDQWKYVLDPEAGIGYIRVSQFNATTSSEFDGALEALNASGENGENGVGGLIIDLRGNPGGLMRSSVEMADRFLSEGVIVSTRGRAFETETARATSQGTLPDFPIVVLIDGQSASASEIFAGALKDNGRARILGQRSYGKASFQGMYTLGHASAGGKQEAELKVTEGRYELPSGVSPHREPGSIEWGVDPSPGFYVPMDGEAWLKAMTTQQEQEVIQNGGNAEGGEGAEPVDWNDANAVLGALDDVQLSAAVEALRLRIEGEAWTAVGEDPPSGKEIASEELARLESSRDALVRDLTTLERRMAALREGGADATASDDLWPDAPLTGGRVEVFDAQGEQVALLEITGEDLETWLKASSVEVREARSASNESPVKEGANAKDPNNDG
jgi:carboxyl-terminal processing protease